MSMKNEQRQGYAQKLIALGFDLTLDSKSKDMVAAIHASGFARKTGVGHAATIDAYLVSLAADVAFVPVKAPPRTVTIPQPFKPRRHFRDADIEAAQPPLYT